MLEHREFDENGGGRDEAAEEARLLSVVLRTAIGAGLSPTEAAELLRDLSTEAPDALTSRAADVLERD